MNKYVVAYWSDHTGELLQELVEANTPVDAVKSYMQWEDTGLTTMEALTSLAADCGSMVSVLDVTPKHTCRFEPALPNMAAYRTH